MTSYELVMPEDMNHYGFLFGGKMLMWIDEIAWMAVSGDYPGVQFVTVGMSEVTFKKSVHPRSVLRFDAQRVHIGTTSVTYHTGIILRSSFPWATAFILYAVLSLGVGRHPFGKSTFFTGMPLIASDL